MWRRRGVALRRCVEDSSAPLSASRLGVRVSGLGFGVEGLGFGVWGLGVGGWGLGFGVKSLGSTRRSELRVDAIGLRVWGQG